MQLFLYFFLFLLTIILPTFTPGMTSSSTGSMRSDSDQEISSDSESTFDAQASLEKANRLMRAARSKNPPTDAQVNPNMAALAYISPSRPIPPSPEALKDPAIRKAFITEQAAYEHAQETLKLHSTPSNPDRERLFLLTGAAKLFESVYLNTEADPNSRWAARSNLDAIYAKHPHLRLPEVTLLQKHEDEKIKIPQITNLALLEPFKKAQEDSEKKVDAYFKNSNVRQSFMERIFAKELLPIYQEKERLEKECLEKERKEKEAQKAEIKKANRIKAAEAEKAAQEKAAAELEAQKKAAELKKRQEEAATQKAAKDKAAQQALQKLKAQQRQNEQDPEKVLLEACKGHIHKKEYAQASQGYWQILQTSKNAAHCKESQQGLEKLYSEKKDRDSAYYMAIANKNDPAKLIEYFIEAEDRRDTSKERTAAEPLALKAKKLFNYNLLKE